MSSLLLISSVVEDGIAWIICPKDSRPQIKMRCKKLHHRADRIDNGVFTVLNPLVDIPMSGTVHICYNGDMITDEMKDFFYHSFPRWIPWAVGLTLIFGAMYGISQQVLRQSANDPQIQIAEDAAAAINAAEPVSFFNSQAKTDIGKSLTPYLVIYDANGAVVASTGQLNGVSPTLPRGVLQSSLASGESRLTWQPQPDVRSAIVVIPVKGIFNGFVMVGRSLREVEKREDQIGKIAFSAWFVSLVAVFGTLFLVDHFKNKRGFER